MNRLQARIVSFPFEALAWTAGLILPLLIDPRSENHFSVCLFAIAGFDWCPGCGLGRSIAFLYEGKLQESFAMHPLGFIAVIILISRIIILTRNHLQNYGKGY